jgi:hypothetical protein
MRTFWETMTATPRSRQPHSSSAFGIQPNVPPNWTRRVRFIQRRRCDDRGAPSVGRKPPWLNLSRPCWLTTSPVMPFRSMEAEDSRAKSAQRVRRTGLARREDPRNFKGANEVVQCHRPTSHWAGYNW